MMYILNHLLNFLFVALGLGFVIFFHELGHFLVAKWNGVKIEKFSIGLGPSLLSFQGKETQYVIAAFPLGGFVKMLGEGTEETGEPIDDPRAYLKKPVGARMAIIAAGPVMNLILGFVCFFWGYHHGGLLETPARLGMVVAGLPAYAAGVHTGDEVAAIDGRSGVTFDDLLRSVALSGTGKVVHLDLKRPGHKELTSVSVEPRREPGAERPSIGVNPAYGLELDALPFIPLPGQDNPSAAAKGFHDGDRVVQLIAPGKPPQDAADIRDFFSFLASHRKDSLDVVVERNAELGQPKGQGKRATITVPPARFLDLGFRLTMDPIVAIQGGSVAQEAGFQKGDQIVKVDGKDDFDPMRLPSYCYDHAGQTVTFEVQRPAGTAKTITITAIPDPTPPWCENVLNLEPQEVPGLGLAYGVSTRVAAVTEGSPADRAGLKAGQVIRSMTINVHLPKTSAPKELKFIFDGKQAAWPHTFYRLQIPSEFPLPEGATIDRILELDVAGEPNPIKLTPEPDTEWFVPLRGLRFDYMKNPLPPMGLDRALRRGGQETFDQVSGIYYMFRGLWQQRLGKGNFAGPVRIFALALNFVKAGLAPFLYFLGMLSVNLAVLNFLPIPPLDGGQMAFLVAERVRGRPLPETAQAAGTWAGLLVVVGLMVLFLFQDILSMIL